MTTAPTYSHGLGADYLSDQQIAQLLRAINPLRVSKDGKGFSHVEAYDVRAHLTRIFGFLRWSEEVTSQELIFEDRGEGERPKWTVAYRSIVALTIFSPSGRVLATYTEGAVGDASNQPSRADAHDLALKTSQSQALKRSACNLGDQFALSLYNKGSRDPLVKIVLAGMPQEDTAAAAKDDADVTEHITTPLAPENGEPENPQRETSSPPAQRPQQAPPAPSPAATTVPAAPNGEVSEEAEPDALGYVLDELAIARKLSPQEAMVKIKAAREVATARRLTTRKLESGRTLAVEINDLLQACMRSIEAAAS